MAKDVVDKLLDSLEKWVKNTRKKREKNKVLKKKQAFKKKEQERKAKAKAKAKASVKARKKAPTQAPRKSTAKKPVAKKKPKTQKPKSSSSRTNKPAKKQAKKPKTPAKSKSISSKASAVKEKEIGQVTHYFSRIQVIVLKLSAGPLKVGDAIHIQGNASDFTQNVESMQIESVDVKSAKKGQLVGLQVKKKASVGDKVFKVG